MCSFSYGKCGQLPLLPAPAYARDSVSESRKQEPNLYSKGANGLRLCEALPAATEQLLKGWPLARSVVNTSAVPRHGTREAVLLFEHLKTASAYLQAYIEPITLLVDHFAS